MRAISKVLDQTWEETYLDLCLQGFIDADMPSANHVWGNYLKRKGFFLDFPRAGTVEEIASVNRGRVVLALSGHVVALIDNDYFDTWDSGKEIALYEWRKF